jgi:hypothetical protein
MIDIMIAVWPMLHDLLVDCDAHDGDESLFTNQDAPEDDREDMGLLRACAGSHRPDNIDNSAMDNELTENYEDPLTESLEPKFDQSFAAVDRGSGFQQDLTMQSGD